MKCATYLIDLEIISQNGPFKEFKQDVFIASVELKTGDEFHKLLIQYPNQIIGMKGERSLPFSELDIVRVFQNTNDLQERANYSWLFRS